jgi:hypothetical protein
VTTKTRRLLFLSVLVAALTLPAETILLRAITTPGQDDAIVGWAAGLSQSNLATAASQIEIYPFKYRKAIMRALPVAERASVWRGHVLNYLKTHPQLDEEAVNAVTTAADLITPEYFEQPTTETRAAVHAAADHLVALLGRDQAEYLLYDLGPKDGTFASFEPWQVRLTNTVRGMFALQAGSGICDCAMYYGCADWRFNCVNWTNCSEPNGWPLCGWLFNDPCDGGCAY